MYRIHAGERLEYLHTTYLEDAPTAITAFQGRVLVGVGHLLRIYDLGKKKMLRKCENRNIPYRVGTVFSSVGPGRSGSAARSDSSRFPFSVVEL